LQLFKASVVPVLVSTDVGARGLDIPDVALVVNWDLPDEPEEYTHRVGRTARAGKGGVAISFVTERDEERVLKIEKRISECGFFGKKGRADHMTDTRLEEMTMNEEKVLEKLNTVSTAKRVANMVCQANVPPATSDAVDRQELYASDFGKREEINRMKRG
jgi:ATP-dependent RNA helicase DDX49/DBP8